MATPRFVSFENVLPVIIAMDSEPCTCKKHCPHPEKTKKVREQRERELARIRAAEKDGIAYDTFLGYTLNTCPFSYMDVRLAAIKKLAEAAKVPEDAAKKVAGEAGALADLPRPAVSRSSTEI